MIMYFVTGCEDWTVYMIFLYTPRPTADLPRSNNSPRVHTGWQQQSNILIYNLWMFCPALFGNLYWPTLVLLFYTFGEVFLKLLFDPHIFTFLCSKYEALWRPPVVSYGAWRRGWLENYKSNLITTSRPGIMPNYSRLWFKELTTNIYSSILNSNIFFEIFHQIRYCFCLCCCCWCLLHEKIGESITLYSVGHDGSKDHQPDGL